MPCAAALLQHIVDVSPIRSGAFHAGKVGATVPRVVAEGIFLGVALALALSWGVDSLTVAGGVNQGDPDQVDSLGLAVGQVGFDIGVRR